MAGGAKVRARVGARGALRARRVHAGDARAVVGCQFDPKGSPVAGPSALCAGDHSGNLSPAYIGQAISSGCIRMTNEDVIDLFDQVKQGATVVVLPPRQSGWSEPFAGDRS